MSEEQWTRAQLDAAWAEEALDSLLRRALRNIAWDFTEASMTLEFPRDEWQFRTSEPPAKR